MVRFVHLLGVCNNTNPYSCTVFCKWFVEDYILTAKNDTDNHLAYFRYCLDINLTDEQVNHPLMREAEGIISGLLFIFGAFFHPGTDTL